MVDLRLFGSFARDEAREDSDVDLMCRITRRMGLEFFGIQIALGEKLGREVELFQETQMTTDAVALNLLVIGECADRLPKSMKLRSTLPWAGMVALRHPITHGYTSVDPESLWDVAQDNLPELARELDAHEVR